MLKFVANIPRYARIAASPVINSIQNSITECTQTCFLNKAHILVVTEIIQKNLFANIKR